MLPTTMKKRRKGIESVKIFLHAPPKVGKTSLCITDRTLILDTHDGTLDFECISQPIRTWDEFTSIVLELGSAACKEAYDIIAVDIIEDIYLFRKEGYVKDSEIDHPSDEPFGKGWDMVANKFRYYINMLCSYGYCVVFVSHSTPRKLKLVGQDEEVTQFVPRLSDSPRGYISGMADCEIAMRIKPRDKDKRRQLLLQHDDYETGWRFKMIQPTMDLPLPSEITDGKYAFNKLKNLILKAQE